MIADAVVSQIETAFPELPMPDVTLRQAQLADQSMRREIGEAEWEAEGRRDSGVCWTQVPADTLIECDAALSHLSEEAFVYYVPAYMRFSMQCLTRPIGGPNDVLGTTVFHLTDRANYSLGRYKRLSEAQIQAVIAFLRAVRDGGGFYGDLAAKALQRYWETPESRRPSIIHVP